MFSYPWTALPLFAKSFVVFLIIGKTWPYSYMNHIIKSSSHNKSQICPQLFGLIYNWGFSAKNFQFSVLLTLLLLLLGLKAYKRNVYRYGKRTLFKGIIVYFPKNLSFWKSDFNFLRYLPLKPKTRQRMAMPRGWQCPAWL